LQRWVLRRGHCNHLKPVLLKLLLWLAVFFFFVALLSPRRSFDASLLELIPAVLCPASSVGPNVPMGCTCSPGLSGTVTASSVSPFFVSTCASLSFLPSISHPAVACPANSAGSSLSSGCTCNAGYSGSIIPTSLFPFFTSSCQGDDLLSLLTPGVSCPANSVGSSVPAGCTCRPGFSGTVTATSLSPFFVSTCAGCVSCLASHAQLSRARPIVRAPACPLDARAMRATPAASRHHLSRHSLSAPARVSKLNEHFTPSCRLPDQQCWYQRAVWLHVQCGLLRQRHGHLCVPILHFNLPR
jgi:hypothetical protein